MGSISFDWAFKNMFACDRKILWFRETNQDILKSMHHIDWQFLRELNISGCRIQSLERLPSINMPALRNLTICNFC